MLEKTAPLMYQTSIGIVDDVLKESWNIYHNTNNDLSVNWSHRIAALKLAKECGEVLLHLTREGPLFLAAKQIRKRFDRIVESDNMNNNINPQVVS